MPPEAKAGAPPSIYSNMAQMASKAPAPGAGAPPQAGGDAAGGGAEKKQIVTTLTSVLKKWEELEKDPKGKEIINQMVEAVKKYQSEILKEGPAAGGAPEPAPGGGAEGPPEPAAGGAGGAGGDKGEKVAA